MPAECLVLLPWTVSPPTKIKVHIGGYRVSSLAQCVTKVSAVIPRRIE